MAARHYRSNAPPYLLPRILLGISLQVLILLGLLMGPPYASAVYADSHLLAEELSVDYICHPRLPDADCEAAARTYEWVLTHNWSPMPGYAGGRIFEDREEKLPAGRVYKEYDIYPKPASGEGGRDAKRLVIDTDNQEAWYTADHFVSFSRFSYS